MAQRRSKMSCVHWKFQVSQNDENYETIGGFMMYMLRKIPKKTDFVLYDQYKFEIIDTENFKIDQLMVSFRKDLKTDA